MSTQLRIESVILSPGIYRCTVPWTNEMGYRWKIGTLVRVTAHPAAEYVICCHPGEEHTGLVFSLSSSNLFQFFVVL